MKTLIVLALAAALAAGGYYYWHTAHHATAGYRTTPVKRGNLVATISATGTVEPEEVVDVGAQVAGRIEKFGPDPQDSSKFVNYGTHVEKDNILAKIDDALYVATVEQAAAQVGQNEANLQRAQADLGQMRAKLVQTEHDWDRARKLYNENGAAISSADYDLAQATYETARSTLAVGEAAVVQARKAIVQSKAALDQAKTNLGYCTVKSPVKGVIIDRRVNIGQTVVASLNAPSLFLIAKDLKRIQVWASVNEADIGQIHPGQAVNFTVDAYPGTVFRGTVGLIRLNATMVQNVVNYTVEVNTDNSDGRLLPYLTANLQFEIGRRNDVVFAPNTALRFWPQADQVAPDAREEFQKMSRRRDAKNPDAAPTEKASGDKAAADKGSGKKSGKPPEKTGTVWVEDGGYVRPLKVKVGLSDGNNTELSGDGVDENLELVVGEVHQNGGAPGGQENPFAPKMFTGRRSAN